MYGFNRIVKQPTRQDFS